MKKVIMAFMSMLFVFGSSACTEDETQTSQDTTVEADTDTSSDLEVSSETTQEDASSSD